jgi:hypothetical protein
MNDITAADDALGDRRVVRHRCRKTRFCSVVRASIGYLLVCTGQPPQRGSLAKRSALRAWHEHRETRGDDAGMCGEPPGWRSTGRLQPDRLRANHCQQCLDRLAAMALDMVDHVEGAVRQLNVDVMRWSRAT